LWQHGCYSMFETNCFPSIWMLPIYISVKWCGSFWNKTKSFMVYPWTLIRKIISCEIFQTTTWMLFQNEIDFFLLFWMLHIHLYVLAIVKKKFIRIKENSVFDSTTFNFHNMNRFLLILLSSIVIRCIHLSILI